MSTSDLKMGERFIPSMAGWSETNRKMFLGNYRWASQFIQGKVVLDCACGSGYGTHILAANCSQVVGADVDPLIIQYAQEHYQNARERFEVFSSTAIPYPDGFFDAVISFDTIEHVEDDEKMLEEFRRVTKSEGQMIISTPLGYYRKDHGEVGLFDTTHVREYSAYEWVHLLGRYFHRAEFFTRDSDLNFRQVFPGDFNGIPYEVGFARIPDLSEGVNTNELDEVKHRIALHMSAHIKHLEKELEACKGDWTAYPDSSSGQKTLSSWLRTIRKKVRS